MLAGDPDLTHLPSDTYEKVYEPCEDSYLLMDTLKADLVHLQASLPAFPLSLEVGSGSGILSSYLYKLLKNDDLTVYAVDINEDAIAATQSTFIHNKVKHHECLCMDLVSAVKERLKGKVDVLIFNPPYVPTPPSELKGYGIERSWAGGKDGREILDQLIPDVADLLSDTGSFYLLLLKANKPAEVSELLLTYGLVGKLVLERRSQLEQLCVIRYTKVKSSLEQGEEEPATTTTTTAT